LIPSSRSLDHRICDDDKAGKPVGIQTHIGHRPIAAFGNSDGEWAYDRTSSIGRLDKAFDEAGQRGWTVVDIQQHWQVPFGSE